MKRNMLTCLLRYGAALFGLAVMTPQHSIAQASDCLFKSLNISTGYNPATGTVLPAGSGSLDPKWTVTALSPLAGNFTGPYNAYVISPDPAWVTSAASSWISYTDVVPYTDASGYYAWVTERTFRTCFKDDLIFNLNLASDNYVEKIEVDGTTMYMQPPTAGTTNLSNYTAVSFVVGSVPPGQHTIRVTQVNATTGIAMNNPVGLNIAGSVISGTNITSILGDTCATCNSAVPPPVCDFSYCRSTASPYVVQFQAPVSNPGYTFSWVINGTPAGNSASCTYNFGASGSNDVQLVVKDAAGTVICDGHHNVCLTDLYGSVNNMGPCYSDFTICYNTANLNFYQFYADNTSFPLASYHWSSSNGVSNGTTSYSGIFGGGALVRLYMDIGVTKCYTEYKICPPLYRAVPTAVGSTPGTMGRLTVVPNPAGREVRLLLNAPGAATAAVTITDATGRRVRTWQRAVTAGEQQLHLDIADLPSGVYQVTVRSEAFVQSARMVKE